MEVENCLVVSRHKLLPMQEQDVRTICKEVTQTPELPTDPKQLQAAVQPYSAVIGTLPINLIDMLKKTGKSVYTFEMTSLGTFTSEEEARKLEEQYQGRVAILPPSRPGEPYRATRYDGIAEVVKISIEKRPVIKHDDPLSSYLSQTS